jgi:succinate dehydrogenase / fumarate reductase membrane anchor subunit
MSLEPNSPLAPPARPTTAWIWQAITGAALIVLLAVHMVANHFVVEGGLREYADVVAYLRNPLILIVEALFLVVVTAHAVLGLRAVVLDLGLSDRAETWATRLGWLAGALTVAYGLWLTWVITRSG